MNTCYYVDNRSEIAAIGRDGFSCNHEKKETITGRIGVYVADSPGEPDVRYPDDQILEITLPPGIYLSKFAMDAPGARCREWLIPAHLLNQSARIRLLSKEQWREVWVLDEAERLSKELEKLVAVGFLEHARDELGQPIYRNGQPVWQLSEKGRSIKSRESFEAEFQAAIRRQKGLPSRKEPELTSTRQASTLLSADPSSPPRDQ